MSKRKSVVSNTAVWIMSLHGPKMVVMHVPMWADCGELILSEIAHEMLDGYKYKESLATIEREWKELNWFGKLVYWRRYRSFKKSLEEARTNIWTGGIQGFDEKDFQAAMRSIYGEGYWTCWHGSKHGYVTELDCFCNLCRRNQHGSTHEETETQIK